LNLFIAHEIQADIKNTHKKSGGIVQIAGLVSLLLQTSSDNNAKA
jgi:hypothetical protein